MPSRAWPSVQASRQVGTFAIDFLRSNEQQIKNNELTLNSLIKDKLQKSIKADALKKHAENFQAIAYQTTARNRVFGSPGHNFSALYVYQALEELSEYYTVSYQPFTALYSEGSADLIAGGVDQNAGFMTYSPTGTVTGDLAVTSNLGCTAADYAGVSGKIALISRGTCEFGLKVALAGSAGALGAVIYNNVAGDLAGTLGAPPRPEGPYVPVGAISLDQGLALVEQIAAGTVAASLTVNSLTENRTTMNVIAQTKGGDQNNVIFIGAHLDSVTAGPGINDDGSGSVAILELALQLAKFKTNNAVRFAWWSAEEYGLLGSEYYVFEGTSDADLASIRLYLNFDMIASPNYKYAIYDGDGSAYNISGPAGSAEAEKLFEEFFASKGLKSQPTEFDGRSDYGPFLDAGIAAGGLFTGAEKIKTAEEATWYGGDAGVAYDVNYHKAGDTIDNLNYDAFVTNSKAIAHSVATYAQSFDSLPPKSAPAKMTKRHEWREKRGFATPASGVPIGCMHNHAVKK